MDIDKEHRKSHLTKKVICLCAAVCICVFVCSIRIEIQNYSCDDYHDEDEEILGHRLIGVAFFEP